MKLSVSLSDIVANELRSVAKARNSNVSIFVEASVVHFLELPPVEQERAIRQLVNTRAATTRDGWLRVFHQALAEEFGRTDVDWGGMDNPMAFRHHAGFNVGFLLDQARPTSGPIYVHAFEATPAPDQRSLVQDWTFEMTDPVYAAARSVAEWIRQRRLVRD